MSSIGQENNADCGSFTLLQTERKFLAEVKLKELAFICGKLLLTMCVSEESHPTFTILQFVKGVTGLGAWGVIEGIFRMNHISMEYLGSLLNKLAVAARDGIDKCQLSEDITC